MKISYIYLLALSLFFLSCSEEEAKPKNQIIVDGQVYSLTLEDSDVRDFGKSISGTYNNHYIYEFQMYTEDKSGFFDVQLKSYDTQGFEPGTFEYYDYQGKGDNSFNCFSYIGYIGSSNQDIGRPIGGTIIVKHGSGNLDYSLEFNVELEGNKTLEGAFWGPFNEFDSNP